MSETIDGFRDLRELERDRRRSNFVNNLAILKGTDLLFRQNHEACLFPLTGRVEVIYWPSTQKWMVTKTSRVIRGDVDAFVAWYRKEYPA